MNRPAAPESDPGFIALYTAPAKPIKTAYVSGTQEEAIEEAKKALPKGYVGIQLARRHDLDNPIWTNDTSDELVSG